MKKLLSILLSIAIILAVLWVAPYTSNFMKTTVAKSYATVLGKIGVKEKKLNLFVPSLQSNIGAKEVFAKKGYIEKKGIYLSNSKSLDYTGNLYQIDSISAHIDSDSLSTNLITINDITIDGAKLVIDTAESGTTNIEATVQDAIDYLLSKKTEILNTFADISSDDSQKTEKAMAILGNLLLGDYSRFTKVGEKLSIAVVGNNSEVLELINEINNSKADSKTESLLAKLNLLIKKIVIKNTSIVFDGKVYTLPDLELKDINSSSDMMNKSKENNIEALNKFNEDLQNQPNKIKDLEPRVKEIFANIGASVQKAIIDFVMPSVLPEESSSPEVIVNDKQSEE